jgi:hypothetical protein
MNHYLGKHYFNYYFIKHFNLRITTQKFSDYVYGYRKVA